MRPCILRAVLYSGNIKATTTQDEGGWTALHSTARVEDIGLAILLELLCYNRECVAIQDDSGMTALANPAFLE